MLLDFNLIGEDKLKSGGIRKFIVLKCWELSKWLDDEQQKNLQDICKTISDSRHFEGKKENEYIVINTDEPYAQDVIEILKRNGHWG
ncbi:MAG: hypothetical protein K0Q87_5025 [Neobacillus sp.]|jgi:hypothetical protein|nr:hypothetical protein [Neobacillus sp.]